MSQRVLVTAGGSGIGRAMAEGFAAAGARVCVMDMDAQALADCPDDWLVVEGDVTDEAVVAGLFDRIAADWGGLDVLCANAGIAGPTAAIEDIALSEWRACVSVNLEGAFLAAKYAAPMMKAAGTGAMILTSSTAGLYGYPFRAPYAAAKWAVIGLMKTLAMELGPHGIRVNAICPGSVEGPRMAGVIAREAMAKGTTPEVIRAGYAAGTAMRSFVAAQDIADTAVFLGSERAKLVSGQAISVDGCTFNPDPQV